MDQNRDQKLICAHSVNGFLTKVSRPYTGEVTVFSINGTEKTGHTNVD